MIHNLFKVETGVYSAQGFNSWGVLQVGDWLFRIWNVTKKPFAWRLELFTPFHRFRFCRGRKQA